MIKIKNLFKIIITAVLVLVAFNSSPVKADEYFVIQNYVVDMEVYENNTMDIVETIYVDFTSPRHGIYREIPIKGYMTRYEGTEEIRTRYNAKISDIDVVGYKFETYKESGNKIIKIGDADILVEGQQTYKISYTMDFGDDGIPEYDELYFNLIGTNWDTYIHNAQLSVKMPKEFDVGKIGISTGYEGFVGSDIVEYSIKENTISITTTEILHPYEGVTIRLELPEGYFVNERVPYDWSKIYYVGFALLFAAVLLAWFVVGKDEKIYPAPEFYPPDGLTPAEIGYAVDGTIDAKDVISLLIYWADKGHIKIEERSKRDIYIIKLKPLDDEANEYEHRMFTGLFNKKSNLHLADILGIFTGDKSPKEYQAEIDELINSGEAMDYVRVKDLENVFYITIDAVKKLIRDKYKDANGNRIFTVKSIIAKILTFLLFSLPILFGGLILKGPTAQDPEVLMVGLIWLSMITVTFFVFFDFLIRKWHSTKKGARAFKAALITIVLLVLFFGELAVVIPSVDKFVEGFICVAGSFFMGILGLFMHKRTPEMNKLQEKILGLRMFLNNAEKDRIDTLVEENPEYFYDILPYAYVLGITNKWAKQFEHIAISPPSWYSGYMPITHFSTSAFENNLTRSFSSMTGSMSSTPSSSGGGGGSSGGGGGGGGGGSW